MAIKPDVEVVVEQPRSKVCSVSPQQHDAPLRVAGKPAHSRSVQRDLDGIETTQRLLGEFAQVRLVADAGVAAQAQSLIARANGSPAPSCPCGRRARAPAFGEGRRRSRVRPLIC